MANPTIIDPSSTSPVAVHTNQPLRMVATAAADWYTRTNGGTFVKVVSNAQTTVITTSATVTQHQTFDIFDVAVVTVGGGVPTSPNVSFNVCEGPATGVQVTANIRNEAVAEPPLFSDFLENDDPPLGFPLAMPAADRTNMGTVLLERSYEAGGPSNLVSLYGPGFFLDSAGKLGSRTFIGKNNGLGVFPSISSYHYGQFYFVYDFGRSRTLSLTRHLYEDLATPPNVVVIRGDGRRNTYRYFNYNGGVTYYTPAALLKNKLLKSGAYFQEIVPSGTYYLYNATGTLVGKPDRIVDRYSNYVYFKYDSNHRLQKVIGPANSQGLVPYLGYDSSGRCNVLVLEDYTTAANNRTTYLTYDSSNNLIEITGPELCTAYFSYDSSMNLLGAKDSENFNWAAKYDSNNRCNAIVDALGAPAYYAYDTTNAITTWVDRAKKATYFKYNAYGSPISVSNVGTPADTYQWEAYYLTQATNPSQSGFLVGTQNRLGSPWYYQYDASGNRIAVNDALKARSYFAYNSTNYELASYTDPLGHTVSMTWGTRRNMTQKVDPVGNTTYYSNANSGVLAYKQDRRNGFTYFVFDAAANLTAVSDPLAFTTYYNYNSAGDRIDLIDPLGRVWYWNYDGRSRVIQKFDPLFDEWDYAYDAACNLVSEIDPLENETVYEYDGNDSRIATVDALGNPTYFGYDSEQRLNSRTDANFNTTTWTYDALGRRQNQVDPYSNVKYWAYDAAHESAMVLDENLNAVYYDYDLVGRLAHTKDAKLNQEYYGYDLKGNRVKFTDKNGNSTTYTFDARDLSQNTTNALGAVTYLAYDQEENRVMALDAFGNPTYWNYDLRPLLVNSIDSYFHYTYFLYDGAREKVLQLAPPQVNSTVLAPTYYDYDLAGRLQDTTDAFQNTSSTTYDPDGNVLITLDQRQASNPLVFQYFNYDADNRTIETVDLGQLRTYYYYDPVGNRVQVDEEQGLGRQPWGTSPYGGERVSTYFTFDKLNRLSTALSASSVYSPTVSFTYTGYDAGSRRVQMRVENPQGGTDVRYSYWQYDVLNRVVRVLDPNATTSGGAAGATYYGYDAVGNRITVVDQAGRPTYTTYDAINRQQNQRDAFLDTTYLTYNVRNDLKQRIDPVGRTIYYQYDNVDRMSWFSNALGQVTYFGYDGRNEKFVTQNPRGFYTYYGFDLLGRLSTQTDALSGVRYWGYDEVGNKVLEQDQRGNLTYWAFDQANRIRAITDATGNQTYYGWDAAGSMRQRLDANGNLIFFGYYGYDASRRPTTKMFSTDPWEYFTYDSLGNLTTVQDETGTFTTDHDFLNRVVTKRTIAGNVYYQYDLSGTKTILVAPDGGGTYYVFDAADRLTQLGVFDPAISSTGVRYTYFTYDPSSLRTSKVGYGNNVVSYYGYDVASRLATLNNVGPAFSTTISYFSYGRDANGNVTSTTREGGNPAGNNVYYTFDALDRLTLEEHKTGATLYYGWQYNYDPTSNRYFKYDEVAGKATYYFYNPINKLIAEVGQ